MFSFEEMKTLLMQQKAHLVYIVLMILLNFWFFDPLLCLSFYSLALIVITFSVYEDVVRLLDGYRRIRTVREKEKLRALFDRVYAEAKKHSSALVGSNIEIYIHDTMDINAYSLGRQSLVVTKGCMELMSEEQIEAIIAHELGHFAHHDSYVNILMSASLGIFSVFGFFLKRILRGFEWYLKTKGSTVLIGLVYWAAALIYIIPTGARDLIFMPLGRRKEYRANAFALECGYGESLIETLYELDSLSSKEPPKITDILKKTHPDLTQRIEVLENKLYATE